MSSFRLGLVLFLGLSLVVTGCSKKQDQASLDTGFDSLTSTDELSQLPQGTSQATAVDALPVETAPVTQSVPVPSSVSSVTSDTSSTSGDVSGLTRDQQIQTALKNAGLYNGAIDGKIGPASKRAVEAFQQANGLKVDGKVGPKTWAALEVYLSGKPAESSASSETVVQ